MNPQLRRRLASAALIIGFFVAWELLCLMFGIKDIVLPRPSEILVTLWSRLPAIMPHAAQTLYTTLVGFALGIVFGVLLGALVGSSRLASQAFLRSRWCRSSCCGSAPARCRRC